MSISLSTTSLNQKPMIQKEAIEQKIDNLNLSQQCYIAELLQRMVFSKIQRFSPAEQVQLLQLPKAEYLSNQDRELLMQTLIKRLTWRLLHAMSDSSTTMNELLCKKMDEFNTTKQSPNQDSTKIARCIDTLVKQKIQQLQS